MLRVRRGQLPLLAAAVAGTLPTLGFGQAASWTFGASGAATWTSSWDIASNWAGNAFPNATAASADFGPQQISNASGTVILNNVPVTVGYMRFRSFGTASTGYNLVGTGSLNVANNGSIEVTSGSTLNTGVATLSARLFTPANSTILKAGPGQLVLSGNNLFGSGSLGAVNQLAVQGGTLTASSANALAGLSIITTANDGVLDLQNQTVGASGTVILGLGSSIVPAGGALHVSGNSTWNGPVVTVLNASIGVDAGSTLTVNGNFIDPQGTVGNGLTKVGAGILKVNSLALNGGATLNGGTTQLKVNGTPGGASRVGGLTIAGGATPTASLDITNNSLIVQTANTAAGAAQHSALMSQLLYANNGFAWDQPGLTSSTVQAELQNGNPVSIGIAWNNDGSGNPIFYGDGGDLPKFQGQSVDANSVLVKYTWLGDADLNGVVDANDFGLLQFGYVGGQPYNSWAFGDFDYNGVVDPNDFGLAQFGYVGQGAPLSPALSAQIVAFASANDLPVLPEIAANALLVPEPGTLGLLGMAAGALGLRRRRRQ